MLNLLDALSAQLQAGHLVDDGNQLEIVFDASRCSQRLASTPCKHQRPARLLRTQTESEDFIREIDMAGVRSDSDISITILACNPGARRVL